MEVLHSSVFEAENISLKLHQGSLALFPTDTLPALAACPKHASKLWEIKKRPLSKPLILMGATTEVLLDQVANCALEDALEISKQCWPGALTMVLPVCGAIAKSLNPSGANLGMRVPACRAARDLLAISGPLATTSANLSGLSPCLSAQEAANLFPGVPLSGPVPWAHSSGMASTVITWHENRNWQILRKGAVIPERLKPS